MSSFIIFTVIAVIALSSPGNGARGRRVPAATRLSRSPKTSRWPIAVAPERLGGNNVKACLDFVASRRVSLIALFSFLFVRWRRAIISCCVAPMIHLIEGPRTSGGCGADVADGEACGRTGEQ